MKNINSIKINRVFILGAGFSRAFAMSTSNDIVREVIQYLEVQPRFNNTYQILVNYVRGLFNLLYPDWRQIPPNLFQIVSPYFGHTSKSLADPMRFYEMEISWEDDNCFEEAVLLIPCMIDNVGTPLPHEAVLNAYQKNLLPFEILLSTYLFVRMLRENIRKLDYKWAYELFSDINEEDIILTFNWDLLVETILKDINKDCTLDNWSSDLVKLVKLHGSIDLFGQPNDMMKKEANGNPQFMDKISIQLWRHKISELVFRRTIYPDIDFPWVKYNKSPVLIMPPYYCLGYLYQYIQLNWRKAEIALSNAKEIYIIGYSLSEYDIPFHNLIKRVKPIAPIYIWNPDPLVKKRAEKLFGKNKFKYIKGKASQFQLN